MDQQTQSFLELSAGDELVQLVADKRAAWLWSDDGARILWSNAAGAAFFSAHSISDLGRLTALERSPARPHIARIAEAGPTDKFSIDRLRFYRGLRVMLLTCQCKRIVLGDGTAAALIVCGDKGLAATRDPLPAFAELLGSQTATVFVTSAGAVIERIGELEGTPENLDLPEDQIALFGAIELDGCYHDGVVLQVTDQHRLVVLENAALGDEDEDGGEADNGQANADRPQAGTPEDTGATAVAAVAASGATALAAPPTDDTAPAPADNHDDAPGGMPGHDDDLAGTPADAGEDLEDVQAPEDEGALVQGSDASTDAQDRADEVPDATPGVPGATPDPVTEPDAPPASIDTGSDEAGSDKAGEPETDAARTGAAAGTEEPSTDLPDAPENVFVFQPRRRPVRFAWKMDIDQRFTFLSDEFSDVLGPAATDIVGQTWEAVSARYGLDPRGQIARALDRRDTWSGKTVDWPVSGAALRVPVDMAALPAFDRNRRFEGYRGFGVCRTADAISDPDGPLPGADLSEAGPASGIGISAKHAATGPDAEAEAEADAEAVDQTEDPLGSSEDRRLADPTETASPQEDVSGVAPSGADRPVADQPAIEAPQTDQMSPVQTDAGSGDTAANGTPDHETDREENEATSEARMPSGQDKASDAASSLEDLKPAQPDSFAGKTFLGASAAALVGSLSRFTGKSAPTEPGVPGPSEPSAAPDPSVKSETSLAADAGTTSSEPADNAAVEDADDLPGAALDSRLEALQTGQSVPAGSPQDPAGAERQDDLLQSEEPLSEAADAQSAEIEAENRASALMDPDEGDGNGDAVDGGAEGGRDAAEADEPTGISGTAPLEPAEIESAVKSLAKSYKTAEKKSRDLFDAPPGEAAPSQTEPADDGDMAAGTTDDPTAKGPAGAATLPPVDADNPANDVLPKDGADDARDAPVPALEDSQFDIVDEDSRMIEQTAATLDTAPVPGPVPAPVPDNVSADEAGAPGANVPNAGDTTEKTTTDEREFFEETAAFETEDRAAEEASGGDETPEPPRTGEVIALATARPRVVPVDTSSLSRPERQAFRKIAEALGARLEGDLEDFDAPDREAEPEEDLPPEVPEAGPIDPSLLDRLPIGIAIVDDREVLYANKALLAMLGYRSIAKLSQAGGLEALFIDDAEELPDAEDMDGEVDEAMKLRLSDGGVLNVDAHMHSVPWNGGHGLMISITERKGTAAQPVSAAATPASPNFFAEVRAELDSARNQIAEMDTILETATDGVLVLDLHGTVLKVNGSAEALFSASRSDMIGAPFTEFLAPESHRSAADYLDGLSRNGVASILNDGREVLGQMPTGGLIPLFMTMGRINGSQDDAKYCAVLRDITQWKTAEEELTEAKRQAENASSQKSDFLAKISHEIRTPLNAIIGFSEVMMEERFGPIGNDRYKDYLKDIRTSGSHIMSLINDLLDLSKIEAGKLDLNFSAVSTNDVINECVALMQPQANRERVIIRASLPESVPDVVADPRSLRQIVLNLLSNAIKYNRSGGQVILSTALESNGEVALRVRDTGTGMTTKQLAAALEPFRQLHTSSRGGGTGLGLPLTKALVEANRASFHIDSTPDQGTLVEILFPTQRVLSE
ncbi:MAG: ATP-binding protein [Roseibium sp.]|uniref:ATP-binding protein n=1 Tax=Roseibium sp. TaxID=1936156 RepID=UPI003298828F